MPKLSILKFDGDVLNWRTFWEQFGVSIHSRTQLSDAHKLAYLKDALKDGPAERITQGLAQTAGTYDEAIECLLNRYDRPRLIHQAHVRAIMETLSLKEGNGREIRCLHDVLLQHYKAIKAMDPDNFGETLLTAFIELKLDPTTMRYWQRFNRGHKKVPPFEDLLDFLDLQARDTENSMRDVVKKCLTASNPGKKSDPTRPAWRIVAWQARMTTILCKDARHSSHNHSTREWNLSRTVVYD